MHKMMRLSLLAVFFSIKLAAQTFPQPFVAEYEQAGQSLFVAFSIEDSLEKPMLDASFRLSLDESERGFDLSGHYLEPLGLAWRRVAGMSLVRKGNNLELINTGPGREPAFAEHGALPHTIDGTLAHWLISGHNLEPGAVIHLSVAVPHFPSATEFSVREQVIKVTGRTDVTLGNQRYACWEVVMESAGGFFHDYLIAEPPYLIRQDFKPPNGPVETVLKFVKLH